MALVDMLSTSKGLRRILGLEEDNLRVANSGQPPFQRSRDPSRSGLETDIAASGSRRDCQSRIRWTLSGPGSTDGGAGAE